MRFERKRLLALQANPCCTWQSHHSFHILEQSAQALARREATCQTVPGYSTRAGMSAPVAVVTGATGFVGGELVRQLLEKGWTVRGTVQGSPTSERVQALMTSIPRGHLLHLSIHSANLLDSEAWDTIIQGADYVFHVASPFQVDVPDPEADLLQPALQGTRNVLTSAAKHKDTVKRVVVTSSVAAVHDCHCKQAPSQGELYSEADFNTTSTPDKEAYWVSKVSAEQEAWRIARDQGVDLVTILPEFIMGPVTSLPATQTSLSAAFFKGFLEAADGKVPSGSWIFSDVREVASAHILAATTPTASGRYIVASQPALDALGVTKILQEAFPTYVIPDGEPGDAKFNLDASKAPRELGLKIRPAADTLRDMAKSLVDVGFVVPKLRA